MIEVIKNKLRKIIKSDIEIDVIASEKEDFGHYSTNAAFKLAPILKKKPLEIANELAEKLKGTSDMFSRVEAVTPGFMNFWLAPEFLQSETRNILTKNQESRIKNQNRKLKINVEFVSANPTGPLTMANGRGGFYGDVLCNVLTKAGHKVTREFYVNDTGNQIKMLGESILGVIANNANNGKITRIEDKENLYKGEYIKDLAKKLKIKNKKAEELGKAAVKILLKEIQSSLKKAGIKYDVWFSEEKNLHKTGEVKKVLEFLRKKGLTEERENATWLKGSEVVLIKSDGNPTYFMVDIAYHLNKLAKRKFDLAIDIWGTDHHGAAIRLKKGVELLGIKPEKLKIILTQLVRLVSNGQEVKMSKRAGEFVTMDELLKKVGADVARFFFLMHSPDTHMDFDLDLAKERSQKNPVYYVQYAYVRAKNILAKSNLRATRYDLRSLSSDSEIKLMLEMAKWPDILAQTAEDYQVHRLTKYAMELAGAFHNFYEKERVIGVAQDLAGARLALVSATTTVMVNLFNILGISTPRKM